VERHTYDVLSFAVDNERLNAPGHAGSGLYVILLAVLVQALALDSSISPLFTPSSWACSTLISANISGIISTSQGWLRVTDPD
jgi:hypothetical protein